MLNPLSGSVNIWNEPKSGESVAYELQGFLFSVGYNLQLTNMAQNGFWDGSRIPVINGQLAANNMSGYKHKISSIEFKLGYILRY